MIKIAIVGFGVMGKNHYRVINKIPQFKLVGICDIHLDENIKIPFFTNIDDMIKNLDFDAAIIATPTFSHKKIAIKLINAKKDILIEKPVASNADEGKIIEEEAKRNNVKVCVGYIERFNPVIEALMEELKDKEIYSINITRVGPFPPRIADVGILTDLAVHDIDLIRFISHSQIQSSTIFKSKKIHGSCEDNAILSFKLENDIVASVTTNWLTPFRKRKINVATNKAYYEADLMEQRLIEYSNYQLNNSYVTRKCFVQIQEPLLRQLLAFANFIKTGKPNNLGSVKDSIITLEISLS